MKPLNQELPVLVKMDQRDLLGNRGRRLSEIAIGEERRQEIITVDWRRRLSVS